MKLLLKKIYFWLRGIILQIIPHKKKPLLQDMAEISRILVIRIDRMGDLVLSLPAIKLLQEAFPKGKISVVVRPAYACLLEDIPGIDEVVKYNGLIKTIALLRKKNFELGIDLLMDYALKTAVLARMSGAPLVAGFDIEQRGCLFNIAFKPLVEQKSICEHHLDLIKYIVRECSGREVAVTSLFPKLTGATQLKEEIKSFLKNHGIQEEDLLVGVHPGGYYPSQRWPLERFEELIGSIVIQYQAKVVVIGGLEEEYLIDKLMQSQKYPIIKAAGFSLNRLSSLISSLDLLISNNSGPLHLACSLGIPTLSTMGPTEPTLWWPMGDNHIVIRKDLVCSPCNRAVCRRHECMQMITVEEMLQAAEKQIQRIKQTKK